MRVCVCACMWVCVCMWEWGRGGTHAIWVSSRCIHVRKHKIRNKVSVSKFILLLCFYTNAISTTCLWYAHARILTHTHTHSTYCFDDVRFRSVSNWTVLWMSQRWKRWKRRKRMCKMECAAIVWIKFSLRYIHFMTIKINFFRIPISIGVGWNWMELYKSLHTTLHNANKYSAMIYSYNTTQYIQQPRDNIYFTPILIYVYMANCQEYHWQNGDRPNSQFSPVVKRWNINMLMRYVHVLIYMRMRTCQIIKGNRKYEWKISNFRFFLFCGGCFVEQGTGEV